MTHLTRRHVIGAVASAGLGGAPCVAANGAEPIALHRGVNAWPWFSLTREYPSPRTDYAWPPFQLQRPVPTPGDLERLHRAGLDFIRLPVDPGPFLAADGRQRMDLLASLFEAATQVLAAGLKLVVNLQPNEATHYWVSQRMVGSIDAPAFALYRGLVADVARGLARFDQNAVALEPVNEPGQDCASGAWPPVQNALLAAARAAAPNLTLVASGACGSMIRGLVALDPAPVLALGRVMFTFHFYEPYLFSHQGAPWMREPVYRDLNAVPWPAAAGSLEDTLAAVRARMAVDGGRSAGDKAAAYAETEKVLKVYFDAQPARPFLDQYLGFVEQWGRRHAIVPSQILLGEFGALRSDGRYVASGAPDRARYIRDVREATEARGFPWAFWNLFDGMGMMDDTTRAFDPAIVGALGLRLPPP